MRRALLTGAIGLLAVAAQPYIGLYFGLLSARNVVVQIAALAGLPVLIVFCCAVRERRRRELDQVRSVAEAAQHVLLWPLPDRIGPLRIASRDAPASPTRLHPARREGPWP
ncbi:hypothetical protein ACIQZB_19190 [Streptomyces sp. NPDC097727]|uniref:hypothetical protein n=1 Tax=Streptomyces sp. NPDC097727 TaxID=3366092 RepID=UPI003822CDE9